MCATDFGPNVEQSYGGTQSGHLMRLRSGRGGNIWRYTDNTDRSVRRPYVLSDAGSTSNDADHGEPKSVLYLIDRFPKQLLV
jgi:hypothetical protein